MAEVNIPKSSLDGNNSFDQKVVSQPQAKVESTAKLSPEEKKSFKQKFRESFVGSDASSVGDYLMFKILIPSFKNTLLNMINNGASMFLNNGQTSNNYVQRNGEYVNYNYISSNRATRPSPATVNPTACGLKSISWADEMDALDVLRNLRDYIYNNNYVTVAKYYTLCRIPSLRATYQDECWGWYNLENANVIPSNIEPGRYIINFPRPLYLR